MKKKKLLQKKYTRKSLFLQKTLENFFFVQRESQRKKDNDGTKQIFSENCSVESLAQNKKVSGVFQTFANSHGNSNSISFQFQNQLRSKKSKKIHPKSLNFESFFQKQKKQKFFSKKTNLSFSRNDFFPASFFSGSVLPKNSGKFFPMKKDFLQYWVFPLVGFAFFYFIPSSQTSQNKDGKFPSFLYFGDLSTLKTPNSKNQSNLNFLPENSGQFSFCQKNFSTNLQNFEKKEFEKYSKYYFDIFKKSFHTISTHQTNYQKLQTQVLENWKLESFKIHSFRSQVQKHRNTFSLKWYFLPSAAQKIVQTSLPDQAQFFQNSLEHFPMFEKPVPALMDSSFSPLSSFSFLRYFLNENQRNTVLFYDSQPDQYVQNFLKNLQPESFQFYDEIFDAKKTNSFPSYAFLEKWLQTQSLTKISLKNQKLQSFSRSLPVFKKEFNFFSLDFLFFKKYFHDSLEKTEKKNTPGMNWKKQTKQQEKQYSNLKGKTFQFSAFQHFQGKFQKIPKTFSSQTPQFFEKTEHQKSKILPSEKMFSFLFSPSKFPNPQDSMKRNNGGELEMPIFLHFQKTENSSKKAFPFFPEPFSVQNKTFSQNLISPLFSSARFLEEKPPFFSQRPVSSEYFQLKDPSFFQVFQNFSFPGNSKFSPSNLDAVSLSSKRFSPNFLEIFLQKIQRKKIQNFFHSKVFKTSFLFEKSDQKYPFIFQNSEAFQRKSHVALKEQRVFDSFGLGSPKQKMFLSENATLFLGKSKNLSFRKVSKNMDMAEFSNFRSKKFEKVFRTFFFPYNRRNTTLKSLKQKSPDDKILLSNLSSGLSDLSQKTERLEKKALTQKWSKKHKFLPTSFLKRDAFVFDVWFPEKLAGGQKEQTEQRTHSRIEKEKSFQRKRRLKKQKLETRRRKKRKRFFPRPVWLRFQLYKKFLKVRHPEKTKICSSFLKPSAFPETFLLKKPNKSVFLFPKAMDSFQLDSPFLKKSSGILQTETKKQKKFAENMSQKWGFYWKHGFQEKLFSHKFQLNKNLFREPSSFSGFQKSPISQKSDDYKISRDIFTDFLRFSWKSSWFQTNFPFLQSQLSKNFQKMKEVESQKNFSNSFGLFLAGDRKLFNLFEQAPFSRKTPPFFHNESFRKNLAREKFSWYWNIQNTSSEQNIYENLFLGDSQNFLHSEQVQNLSEYNRFLNSRLSEVLKKMKSQEFFENSSSFLSQKETKFPKRKNENFLANSSFFTKAALFQENFQVPSQPSFPAFSVFSSLFQNSSLKPFGEFPTLRTFWAFHQTNFCQFQEQNSVRRLWTEKKRLESLKSLKGAKKAMKFFQGYTDKTTFQPFSFFSEERKFLLENAQGSKNSFLSSLKPEKQHYFSKLDAVSFKKFQAIEQKCSIFGIQTLQQNSKLSSRLLKFQLLSKKQHHFLGSNSSFIHSDERISPRKPLPQNSAKSSLNFWWSLKKPETFSIFSPFSFSVPESFFSEQRDSVLSFQNSQSSETFASLGPLQAQFFWLAAVSFHFAIFFTLFKLPEIRSLLKFQFLLFSKFSHAFFSVLFAVSNFFQISSKKGKETTTKFEKFFFSFEEQNSLKFSFSSFSSSDFQNFQSFSVFVPFLSKGSFSKECELRKKPKGKFFLFEMKENKENKQDLLFQSVFRVSNISSISSSSFFQKPTKGSISFSFTKNSVFFEDNPDRNISSVLQGLSKAQRFGNFSSKDQKQENVLVKTRNLSTKVPVFQTSGNFQELSISQLSVLFLLAGKSVTTASSKTMEAGSLVSSKVLDSFEFVFTSLYKFLEKPAELIIEWIALIFLVEWSSDVLTFVPDTVETSFAFTTKKFSRSLRFAPFALFLASGNSAQTFSTLVGINTSSFFFQKHFLSFFEQFSSILTQPDIDILVRQRKGMIFWDIWAEILLKTAEKYNVNIPSFVTLKEEQELFLEKLLQDQKFLESLQAHQTGQNFNENQEFSSSDSVQQKSLASYMQNFLVAERPHKLPEFGGNASVLVFENSVREKIFSNLQIQKKFSFFPGFLKSEKSPFGEQKSKIFSKFSSVSLFSEEGLKEDRWSVQQYVTYQGPESDLFIDIHPPVSFQHIPYLKYYDLAQSTLGSLVCEVYGGLFSKQVSKNILVVGSSGVSKSLFLQALAGETEMKIITDNASRYATVQNGVAVGMKYLRDVFDALSFQTPCFFLMENIHILGSKRPLLISDDENVKVLQPNFGMDQQEVHETNQMIYQLMRHSISDFRRPFKGDFSMGIPTNSFVQNFSSFSEKPSGSIFTNSQFSDGGLNNFQRISPNSPFPLEQIESSLMWQGNREKDENWSGTPTFESGKKSFLQFSKEETFAPPATSPFTIFMMKEQKKLKPKKIVVENSWGGFSADQLLSYQKESSFVRSKVATLADMTLSFSRRKFDMITDLLVIIDSVRSNRGFVVFATTHVPSLLDPALRRPGRFDETLSLSQSSNFLTRFEILKTSFHSSVPTFDAVDASFWTENFSERNLFHVLQAAKFSLFHTYNYTPKLSLSSSHSSKNTPSQKKILAHISPISSFQSISQTSTFADYYNQTKFLSKHQFNEINLGSKFFLRKRNLRSFHVLPAGPSHELALAYSNIGIFLGKANLLKDPMAFLPTFFENSGNVSPKRKKMLQSQAFYTSSENTKLQLQVFLAGKVSESLLVCKRRSSFNKTLPKKTSYESGSGTLDLFEKKYCFSSKNSSIFEESYLKKNKGVFASFDENSSKSGSSSGFWSAFGGESTWRNTMPFLFYILQKRYLFTKNSLLSKMLFFENRNQQKQPPSPPNSSVFMPGKKFEQFKRTEGDFVSKGHFSMNQKIQMHQQQKFLKQLYNIPQADFLFSEKSSKKKSFGNGSFQELAYLDSLTARVTSSHFYYKKYFVQRHRFSHLNQWWSGFFPEHTAEATYLSDVDWRTMFGTSLQPEKSNFAKDEQTFSSHKKAQLSNFEFSMDFPDAEQYYNPRNRRWYFEKTSQTQSFSAWFTFDIDLQYEIYYHSFYQVFSETFSYFDKNREYMDFFVFQFLRKGFLSELDFLTTKTRFEKEM